MCVTVSFGISKSANCCCGVRVILCVNCKLCLCLYFLQFIHLVLSILFSSSNALIQLKSIFINFYSGQIIVFDAVFFYKEFKLY